MNSPIAIQSAREAQGREVKGTGRRSTAYRRPPIVDIIAMCGSVQALGRLRWMLANASWEHRLNPSEKTERSWERAFWKRVIEIMLTTDNPTFVYNETLRWAKPAYIADAIEVAFQSQCKSLP